MNVANSKTVQVSCSLVTVLLRVLWRFRFWQCECCFPALLFIVACGTFTHHKTSHHFYTSCDMFINFFITDLYHVSSLLCCRILFIEDMPQAKPTFSSTFTPALTLSPFPSLFELLNGFHVFPPLFFNAFLCIA